MPGEYIKTLNVEEYSIQIWKDPADDFNIHATIKKAGHGDISTREVASLIGNLVKWHRLLTSFKILRTLLKSE